MKLKIFYCLLLSVAMASFTYAQQKPVYVLVHGAWHGGWCWNEVSAALQAKGAIVYTPTLGGMAEYANTLDTNINLNTHIENIVSFIIKQDLHHVILVGHSYAGIVITGVADRIPERLHKLIYLDAMLAENGQSALSTLPAPLQENMRQTVAPNNGLYVPVWPASGFGVTDTTKAKWVDARLTPQPFRTFSQPLVLVHPFGNHIPKTYIACDQPEMPQLNVFAERAKNSKEWTFTALHTGHDAMVTAPVALSNLLTQLSH